MATKGNLSAVLRKVDDLCLVGIHFILFCTQKAVNFVCNNVFFRS